MSTTNRWQHPDTRTTTVQKPGFSEKPGFWLTGAGLAVLLLSAGLGAEAQDRPKEITNSIGMKLVLIPAGKFMMGSPKDEKDRFDDEEQHEVEITKPFYMGVYDVTQAEYEKVMGKNPSYFSAAGDGKDRVKDMDTTRFPVEMISWADAVEFCRKLSEMPEEKQAGRVYRLPTEVEWEYACRGGTVTAFHYGAALSSTQANFRGNFPYGGAAKGPYLERTTKVGSYQPNAYGLYDMHGNVLPVVPGLVHGEASGRQRSCGDDCGLVPGRSRRELARLRQALPVRVPLQLTCPATGAQRPRLPRGRSPVRPLSRVRIERSLSLRLGMAEGGAWPYRAEAIGGMGGA